MTFRESIRRVKAACKIVHWGGGDRDVCRISYIFWGDREYYVFSDSTRGATEVDRLTG